VTRKPNAVPKKQWQLARHMQKVRIAQGFTQEQLAEKIGTSTTWIGYIETGRPVPNLKMLQKIARALQVKVKELILY
jgi:XRE family transcriptional regulator, fatty acid utilization regulator